MPFSSATPSWNRVGMFLRAELLGPFLGLS
jgi:hypothetical protein